MINIFQWEIQVFTKQWKQYPVWNWNYQQNNSCSFQSVGRER